MSETLREQLRSILYTKGYRRFEEPITLASGELSYDFIDGKRALADWADLALAGRAIADAARDGGVTFDAVGGLELGACALTISVAAAVNSRWFFVRKQPKDRGTRQLVEGAQIGDGDRVFLVEDVVTTGGSIFLAYDHVLSTGATVVGAATLVDRGDLAAPRFAELGVPYFPMVTYAMLGIEPVRGRA